MQYKRTLDQATYPFSYAFKYSMHMGYLYTTFLLTTFRLEWIEYLPPITKTYSPKKAARYKQSLNNLKKHP